MDSAQLKFFSAKSNFAKMSKKNIKYETCIFFCKWSSLKGITWSL